MNNIIKALTVNVLLRKLSLLTCLVLLSCTSLLVPEEPDHDKFIFEEPFLPDIKTDKPKSIFVFIDGTGNNRKIPTNIYRLFQELVTGNNDKHTVATYIEGVGNSDSPISEKVFGFGMDDRIAQAYAFVMQQYRVGDSVYVFGFSRGAYAARALAGLISYTGVLKVSDEERKNKDVLISIGKQVLEISKSASDSSFADEWQNWKPKDAPLLADSIYDATINDKKERVSESVDIKFLGVWETVPNSSTAGLLGFLGSGLYKTASYPAIRHIAHAVASDEKRSLFKPRLLSPALNPAYTTLNELAFSGSHADIGGGTDDLNNDLPNISLNWMLNLLSKTYKFPNQAFQNKYKENPNGLAHLSISEFDGNLNSDCQDRELSSIPEHASIAERKKAGAVEVRVCEAVLSGIDGKSCKRDQDVDGIFQVKKTEQANINCNYIKQQKWIIE
jgi:uncharacterized protein (DUF2235 family)